MINPEQKLNPNIFSDDIEKKAIRDGFGTGVVEVGEQNSNVVVLTADLNESTRAEAFSKKFPERFIEVGIAEQNLASTASGLAHMGKIPFATSYAMFSPGRNWEQIRTTVCYNDQPVKIIGSHAGLTTGPDGATHQALEDIALTRVLPNMVVIVPGDSIEAEKATLACVDNKKPTYIRLGREKTPVITTEETPFEIGKANVLYESNLSDEQKFDVTFISTGFLTHNALLVAEKLSRENNLKVAVVHFHTIKPLDVETLLQFAKKSERIFTVEEHQVAGGLGSAVAEYLSETNPIKIYRLGVNDQFGQSGKPMELIEKYGLDAKGIYKKVLEKIS